MWNNLRFFNGTKSELQLVQDADNIWTGKVYLPEVSASLYETVNLFILEDLFWSKILLTNFLLQDTPKICETLKKCASRKVGKILVEKNV